MSNPAVTQPQKLIRHVGASRFPTSSQTGFNSSRVTLTTNDSQIPDKPVSICRASRWRRTIPDFRSNRFQFVAFHVDARPIPTSDQTGFIRRAMSFRMSKRASQDGIDYYMDTLSVSASRYIRLKIDLMIKVKNGNLVSRSKVLSL